MTVSVFGKGLTGGIREGGREWEWEWSLLTEPPR